MARPMAHGLNSVSKSTDIARPKASALNRIVGLSGMASPHLEIHPKQRFLSGITLLRSQGQSLELSGQRQILYCPAVGLGFKDAV